ncbi:NADP-dependent oxidoreductase [Catenovulum sp. SM1970]|uniref:NADP-dependent oxidoreductase n=1 Tax=Marinifaba aquimaris TaxID=2741323 RepID=UPI001572CE31|nr:NADP-dependent oxidoreductase [Marinifaba aquimaris]NTS78441.1 NADP-dependent oxidoreductase [Marinifaba aquimaris]
MSLYNAISIPFFGDSHVLRIDELELPSINPQQVLIKTIAASVNPIDCKTRAGLGWAAQENKDKLPWTPGYDMSGVVAAVGDPKLSDWVGKLVFGMIGFPFKGGAYSQYVVVNLDEVLAVPDGVNTLSAAALPLAGLTAYQATIKNANIQPGDNVLVLGATGGVGHIAAQIAEYKGAHVSVTGSEAKRQLLSSASIGQNWQWLDAGNLSPNCVAKIDKVIDCVGGDFSLAVLAMLDSAQSYITLPTITAQALKDLGQDKAINVTNFLVESNQNQLQQLADWLKQGIINVYIGQTESIQNVAIAHQIVEQSKVAGKTILMLD